MKRRAVSVDGDRRLRRRYRVALLAATLFVIGCGAEPEADEVVVDTLALLDRELDLAMSAALAESRSLDDKPQRDAGDVSGQSGEKPLAARPRPPAPRPPPAPDPEPAPSGEGEPAAEDPDSSVASGPAYERRTVGGGVTFSVTLMQELSTRHNRVGDLFSATLDRPLMDDRGVVAPAGALVVGEVNSVQRSTSHGRPAVISLAIHEVSFDGETFPLTASIVEANPETRSRTSTAEKAAKIGGAAVAGAILGTVIGGDALGTIIGTAAGGAAGTAIVLGTEDVDAVLPSGSRLVLRLDAPLELDVAVRS